MIWHVFVQMDLDITYTEYISSHATVLNLFNGVHL